MRNANGGLEDRHIRAFMRERERKWGIRAPLIVHQKVGLPSNRGIRLDPRAMFSRADDNVLGKSLKLSCCLFSRVPLTFAPTASDEAAHRVIPGHVARQRY